jgi:hypothetical protein
MVEPLPRGCDDGQKVPIDRRKVFVIGDYNLGGATGRKTWPLSTADARPLPIPGQIRASTFPWCARSP